MFNRETILFSLFQGLGLLVIALAAFLISLYRGQGAVDARTISFTTLIVGNITLIWSNRSQTRTIPEILRTPNGPLWAVTGGTLLVTPGGNGVAAGLGGRLNPVAAEIWRLADGRRSVEQIARQIFISHQSASSNSYPQYALAPAGFQCYCLAVYYK